MKKENHCLKVTISRSAWYSVVTEIQLKKHIIEMKNIFNGLVSIFNGKMQLKSNRTTFHLRHGIRHS